MKFRYLLLTLLLVGGFNSPSHATSCGFSLDDLAHGYQRTVSESMGNLLKQGFIKLASALSTDGKAAWFCNGSENGHLDEGCTFEEALEHHRASEEDHEKAKEFVGQVSMIKGESSYNGTGFLFQTEKCKGNNLVFTNAHVFFDQKTGEKKGSRGDFCLINKCYSIDIAKTIESKLYGVRTNFGTKERTHDYAIVFLKEPASGKKTPSLSVFKENHLNKNMKLSGVYKAGTDVDSVHKCHISYSGQFFDKKRGSSILHNCPTEEGFSGSPITYNNQVIAVHSGGGDSGKSYGPFDNNNYNVALPITEELINNLNRYCSGLKPYTHWQLAQMIDERMEREERAEREREERVKQERRKAAQNYLSSSSPDIRLKGVQELYQQGKEDRNARKETLELFEKHIKDFTASKDYKDAFPQSPSADIQELLNIMSMRGDQYFAWNNIFENLLKSAGHEIDLSGAYLAGANLKGAELRGANLQRVELRGVNLNNAKLQGANLADAKLQGAILNNGQLQGANLWHTKLWNANLAGAELQGANLENAQLWSANLEGAELQGASLWDTQLQGANLAGAQFQSANLTNTQLQGAYSKSGHERPADFDELIESRTGKFAELDTVTLKGGLTEADLERIESSINLEATHWNFGQRERLNKMLDTLRSHIGKSPVTGLSGAQLVLDTLREMGAPATVLTDTYNEEEAEQWIEKFSGIEGREQEEEAEMTDILFTISFTLYLLFLAMAVAGSSDKVRLPLARHLSGLLANKEKALHFTKKLNRYFVAHYSKKLDNKTLQKYPYAATSTLGGVELFSNILFYTLSILWSILLIATLPMAILAFFTFVS